MTWQTRAGYLSDNEGTSITSLSDGSSIITGYIQYTTYFGSIETSGVGGYDGFIAKLNADGTYAWVTKAGGFPAAGGGDDAGTDIASLTDGSSIVTGTFR